MIFGSVNRYKPANSSAFSISIPRWPTSATGYDTALWTITVLSVNSLLKSLPKAVTASTKCLPPPPLPMDQQQRCTHTSLIPQLSMVPHMWKLRLNTCSIRVMHWGKTMDKKTGGGVYDLSFAYARNIKDKILWALRWCSGWSIIE